MDSGTVFQDPICGVLAMGRPCQGAMDAAFMTAAASRRTSMQILRCIQDDIFS
jgi:hypothetical protein